jgi:hypothetical protein
MLYTLPRSYIPQAASDPIHQACHETGYWGTAGVLGYFFLVIPTPKPVMYLIQGFENEESG